MRKPAEIVRMEPLRPARTRQSTALVGRRKDDVLGQLQHLQRRGQVETAGQLQLIPRGPYAGQYAVKVVLVPGRPDPTWATALVKYGSAAVGAGAVAWALAWFLLSLSAPALFALCAVPMILLAVWCKAKYGRRSRITITQSVVVER